MRRVLPILDWGRGYGIGTLIDDLLAAMIVTIMLVPQSLAYAMLAGLPPQVGLYASILPLVAYALFGTSRTLAVGPVAVIAEDGTVELSLPELDADLEAVLEPVSRLLWDNDALACPLTVSDPSVGVTQALFQSVAVPGVVLFNGFGAFAATLSGAPLPDTADTTLAAADLYGLVYATGPVDVSASGPGCEAQGHTVDVSLEAGWNWVRWEVVLDAMDDFSHAHLTSTDPPQELWATLIPFI